MVVDQVPCFAPQFAEQSDGYDPDSYQTIAKFQSSHFWFRGRNELITNRLKKYFPDTHKLLEIGCGTGQVLRAIKKAMPETELCGTEIYLHGLSYAKNLLPDVTFLQVDAREIPFEAEFDVICAFDVIEHVDDDNAVLREIYRACRPGGGIVLTVPQHRWLWSYKDEMACHKRRYTRLELDEKVRAAGFKVISQTSFVSLLLPLMYLSRLRRAPSTETEAFNEFRISPLLNRVFLACSRLENLMIRIGFSLPFGGSLMLVGTKSGEQDGRP